MKIKRPEPKQPIPKHAKKVFHGALFDVYQWKQRLFDGSIAVFERLKRPDTVVIFPILPNGKILLIKEKQPGSKETLGAISGRVEKGESFLDTAKRELLEESGYEAKNFILWESLQPVNKIDWALCIFVAKGLKKKGKPKLDGGEKITQIEVSFNEFLKLSTNKHFGEPEILRKILEACLNPDKKKKLKKLFNLR